MYPNEIRTICAQSRVHNVRSTVTQDRLNLETARRFLTAEGVGFFVTPQRNTM